MLTAIFAGQKVVLTLETPHLDADLLFMDSKPFICMIEPKLPPPDPPPDDPFQPPSPDPDRDEPDPDVLPGVIPQPDPLVM
jgi:hypothetical protein